MSIEFNQLTDQNAKPDTISNIYDDKDFLASFNKLTYDTENIEDILTSRPFRTFLQTKLDDFNQIEKDQTNNDQAQKIIDEQEKVSDVITKLDELTEKFMCEKKTVEIEPLLEKLMASDPKYAPQRSTGIISSIFKLLNKFFNAFQERNKLFNQMNYFKENYLLGMLSLKSKIMNEHLTKYISNYFESCSLEELDTYQMYLNPMHKTLVDALLGTISKRYNELVNLSRFSKFISKITGQAKKNKDHIKKYAKINDQLLDKKEKYEKSNSDDASTIKASEIKSYNQLLAEEKERVNMGAEEKKRVNMGAEEKERMNMGAEDPKEKTVSIKEAPHLMGLDVDDSCEEINLAGESKKDVADLAQASMQTLRNHAKKDEPDLSDPLFYLNKDSKIVINDNLKNWVESILSDEEAPEFTAYEKKVKTALKEKQPIKHSKRSTVRQCVNDLNEFNLHQPKPLKSASLEAPKAAETKPQEGPKSASDKVNEPPKSILKKIKF
ncbi:MAG: hypothetical protein P8L77_02590 [Gammaproteobacteria bacterium]|nr:hypothetical protein [Gammaproteobacteria bacterium]